MTSTSSHSNGVPTHKALLHGEVMKRLLNRSEPSPQCLEDLETIRQRWKYDLFTRRPAPALLVNGELKPTDLDLACFLSALADRGAVVQFPHYKAMGSKAKTSGKKAEVNLSTEYRRGKITGLTSDKETASFGITLNDLSVLNTKTGQLGGFRTFGIQGHDGNWHPGWEQIDFCPTEAENAFIQDFMLAVGEELTFDTFVHPSRYISIFGKDYFLLKTAITWATDYAAFLTQELKRLTDAGFEVKATKTGGSSSGPGFVTEDKDPRPTKSVTVTAFEAEVDVPFKGKWPKAADSGISFSITKDLRDRLRFKILPDLRFASRTTEFSFLQHTQSHGFSTFPAWIPKGTKWEQGWRAKGKRTDWAKLALAELAPGTSDVALRFRTWRKEEKITI